jgi:ATP-dependent DNA helicase RecG
LGIFTCRDLLFHFPFRYIDRTKFHNIRDVHNEGETVQLRGTLRRLETLGEGKAKRLVGTLRDETGIMEMVWFRSVQWLEKSLVVGKEYIVFGRVSEFNGKFNIPHPEMEEVATPSLLGERKTSTPCTPLPTN